MQVKIIMEPSELYVNNGHLKVVIICSYKF